MSAEAAAAHHAQVIAAIKASGTIVRVEPEVFHALLRRAKNPLVVHALGGFLTRNKYLTSYKGLAFATRSSEPIELPLDAEVVTAQTIWTP